jgi:GNAT superfamily N-acetyltransferase
MAANDHLGLQFKVANGRQGSTRHTTVSAHLDGQKVGAARMTNGGTELDSLHVAPSVRGQGVGHALMNEVTTRFGGNTLRLHASPFTQGNGDPGGPDQSGLQRLYSAHGFEPDTSMGEGYMIRRPGQ